MTGALIWKEYREGRMVWVALALLGLATVTVMPIVLELLDLGQQSAQAAHVLQLMQLWMVVYALVAGSMLLAGERESRTLPFLDLLQPYRITLWSAKALAVLLMGTLMGSLFALMLGLSPLAQSFPGHYILWLPLLGFLDALPWGLLASSLCRTVLPAVGVAAATFLLGWIFCSLFALPNVPMAYLLVARLVLDLIAVGLSVAMFCQPEPDGPPDRQGMTLVKELLLPRLPAQGGYFRALTWLCWRQGRGLVLGMLVAAVISGFLLAPMFVQFWPVGTLLVGLLCGLGVWRDEQTTGSSRFLGDQRLPLFRLWLGKTVFWLGAAVLVVAVALICASLSFGVAGWHGSGASRSEAGELAMIVRGQVNIWLYMTMWLPYGFAVAQLSVMISRKTVVTFVLALMMAIGLAGLWAPSLAAGGLPAWQVLLLPLVWMVAGAVLMWAWAGEGLRFRRLAVVLGPCGLVTTLWLTGSLLWRAWEVPESPRRLDIQAARAAYPTPEKNVAVRQFQLAVGVSLTRPEDAAARPMPLPPPGIPGNPPRGMRGADPAVDRTAVPVGLVPDSNVEEAMVRAVSQGWAQAPESLGTWLDDAFRGNWVRQVEEAARLPLAVFDDPTLGRASGSPETLLRLRWLAAVFSARAIQAQAEGRPDEAVQRLQTALAISRHLRNRAPVQTLDLGFRAERWPIEAADRLTPALVAGAPEQARKFLQVLTAHEEDLPPLQENLDAEFLLAASRLETLGTNGGLIDTGRRGASQWYSQVLTVSLQTPWERTRAERIFHRVYARAHVTLFEAAPPPPDLHLQRSSLRLFISQNWGQIRASHESNLCRVRGQRLMLALALYQRDRAAPAADLAALTPDYLKSIPDDPFTGRPFGYRLAGENEVLDSVDVTREELREGQGLVWSAGTNRRDDGGRMQSHYRGLSRRSQSAAGDWIFLVPVPSSE